VEENETISQSLCNFFSIFFWTSHHPRKPNVDAHVRVLVTTAGTQHKQRVGRLLVSIGASKEVRKASQLVFGLDVHIEHLRIYVVSFHVSCEQKKRQTTSQKRQKSTTKKNSQKTHLEHAPAGGGRFKIVGREQKDAPGVGVGLVESNQRDIQCRHRHLKVGIRDHEVKLGSVEG
jgi:Zn finger protein HypA/HybF involved in hydrogenase expression